MFRIVAILILFFCFSALYSQNKNPTFSFLYGYSTIPIHIQRTAATRWMVYPTFEAGYQVSEKLEFIATFLLDDIRLSKYSNKQYEDYSETPHLSSYNEAVMYIGQKFDLSEFYNYLFVGVKLKTFKSGFLQLNSGLQVGFRSGHTFVLSQIFEEPSNPSGFEAHASVLSSNSPGIRFGISPRFVFRHFISLETSVGSYIFINWPAFQPFGNVQIGFSF